MTFQAATTDEGLQDQPLDYKSQYYESVSYPLLLWLVMLFITGIAISIFDQVIGRVYAGDPGYPAIIGRVSTYGAGFHSWDGLTYIYLAIHGYKTSLMTPFFPLLPLLIRFLHSLTHLPYSACAFLIINTAYLLALIVLYKMLLEKLDQLIARRVLWFLTLFPTAMFFNVVYSESLTLFTTIFFFYCLERQYWYIAMLSGFFAAMAHTLGVILAPAGLVFLIRQRQQLSAQVFWLRFLSLGLIVAGLMCYMFFLYKNFGNPFIFLEVEKHWHRAATIPIFNIFQNFIYYGFHHPHGLTGRILINLLNGVCTLFMVCMGIFMLTSYKNSQLIKPEMKVFFFLTLFCSICSGPHHGSLEAYGRFMVVLFPAFIVFADKFRNPTLFLYTMAACIPFKVLLTGVFVSGLSLLSRPFFS